MLNPKTGDIETLEAYKYDGDDRITRFILRGLGKEPGYKGFTISFKMIQDARKLLKKTNYNDVEGIILIEEMTQKAQKIAKENIREKNMINNLLKSKKGKEKVSAAKIIANMDEKPINSLKNLDDKSNLNNEFFEDLIDDDDLEPFPTEWDNAKKDLIISDFNNRKKEENL